MNEELDAFQKRALDLVNAKGGTKTEAERMRNFWLFHADPTVLIMGEALIGGHMLKARRDAIARSFTLRADAAIEADLERKAQILKEADEFDRTASIISMADHTLEALKYVGRKYKIYDRSHARNYASLLKNKKGFVNHLDYLIRGIGIPERNIDIEDTVFTVELDHIKDLGDVELRNKINIDLLRRLHFLGNRENLNPSKFRPAYEGSLSRWIKLIDQQNEIFEADCYSETPNPEGGYFIDGFLVNYIGE